MTIRNILLTGFLAIALAGISIAQFKPTIAIIGTGDMGDSLGPKLADLGYEIVYGSREPDGDKARSVVNITGGIS